MCVSGKVGGVIYVCGVYDVCACCICIRFDDVGQRERFLKCVRERERERMSMFRAMMMSSSRNNIFRRGRQMNSRRHFGGHHKTVPGQLQVRFFFFRLENDDDSRKIFKKSLSYDLVR